MDYGGAIVYGTITPCIEKDLTDFIKDVENIVEIPVIFFDAVSASGFASIYDGLDQYVGNPHSIELFGILALGYLRKRIRKDKQLGQEDFQFNAQEYLDSFLYANSFFVRNKYMRCKYYSFKKGKFGGKLVLELAEGSRRFGASYILTLINNLTLKIPCQLKVLVVDKERAEKQKEYIRLQIEELKRKQNSLLHHIFDKIQSKLLKIRNKEQSIPISIMDEIIEKQRKLEIIESDLYFANYIEPVLPELLSIIIGKAEEKDFIRIFEHFNTLGKEVFKDWLL